MRIATGACCEAAWGLTTIRILLRLRKRLAHARQLRPRVHSPEIHVVSASSVSTQRVAFNLACTGEPMISAADVAHGALRVKRLHLQFLEHEAAAWALAPATFNVAVVKCVGKVLQAHRASTRHADTQAHIHSHTYSPMTPSLRTYSSADSMGAADCRHVPDTSELLVNGRAHKLLRRVDDACVCVYVGSCRSSLQPQHVFTHELQTPR